MLPVLNTFYARWRVECGAVPLLREDVESPPERLLQAVWRHQRLLRDKLVLVDGRPLRVLHPGFWNLEGGPDFRGALLQFGDNPPVTGDIEVDLRASAWRGHGHEGNPNFKQVILHVIWEGDRGAANGPPVLVLRPVLDSKIGELSLWLGAEAPERVAPEWRGKCAALLAGMSAEKRLEFLHEAALVRLQSKGSQFSARARDAGWEQALWEGLFRALGYKHNVWPMQRVCELRDRWHSPGLPALRVEARLFGISGLLPVEVRRGDSYARRVWDEWWRERDEFSDCILPQAAWRLHGLRPSNHPQRRLAQGAQWSALADLPKRLERWCAEEMPKARFAVSLLKALEVPTHEFWGWHFSFRSGRLKKPQPLLGPGRATDLAVNVVLPWLWIRAVEGKNESLRRRIEARYFAWPCAEDNSVLRLARQRMLSGATARVLPDAAAQQGLMQIVRDFCDKANAACDGCKFPELVREYAHV